jgi:hypothetical protein
MTVYINRDILLSILSMASFDDRHCLVVAAGAGYCGEEVSGLAATCP